MVLRVISRLITLLLREEWLEVIGDGGLCRGEGLLTVWLF
jgi:hypothetical protein